MPIRPTSSRAAASPPSARLLGTVDEGKLADLVLLDANLFDDITNTQRIRAVFADGRLYRRTDLGAILAEVEGAVHE